MINHYKYSEKKRQICRIKLLHEEMGGEGSKQGRGVCLKNPIKAEKDRAEPRQ